MLDDLLETDKLLDWHNKEGANEKPHMGHTNLNYHAKAFEQVDHYLRNVLAVLSEPSVYFKSACSICMNDSIKRLPEYITSSLSEFYAKIDPCQEPDYTIVGSKV